MYLQKDNTPGQIPALPVQGTMKIILNAWDGIMDVSYWQKVKWAVSYWLLAFSI
jgi:hypothetical protein